jgi:hypothetical protein
MSEENRARTAVARLELVAHGTVRNYDGDGRGGSEGFVPVGGISREEEHTFLHFIPRLRGARSERDFSRIADEAEQALRDFKVSKPAPRDSDAWKDKVAVDTRKASVVAAEYNITRQYVWLIRKTRAGIPS